MNAVFIFAVIFGTIFGIAYVFLMARNKERMALIEKGVDASLFYSKKEQTQFNWSKLSLKIGMFFMGIALGILSAAFLEKILSIPEPALYFALIFLFGGLSLVLFYVFDRKSK